MNSLLFCNSQWGQVSKVTISQLRHIDRMCIQRCPETRINTCMVYYSVPFMHIHTNFQRNWTNNVNFTAHLMRVRSSVTSDNSTAYTHRSHTHSIVQWRESIPCVATCLYTHAQRLHMRFLQDEWDRLPQARIQTLINSMRIRIEACGGPTMYWFSLLDNVCVGSVCLSCEIVTFSTWPRPD